ncbi:polymeric immunoglobulin receptor-like isoform X1 [Alosa sapidissima]|uniref:polymeric immunoglobulin receptor-like isoform X1 n=1 Tax=Alosa sapidissima TaxID=34773 RepID=UPI001C092C17|nr:polymeric immunoglobulin receptor-like isoform X1 [Alosa sapidissima]
MKAVTDILLPLLFLAKGGCCAFTVEGYAGDSIIIKCKYKDKHRDQNKYFCKDDGIGGKYLCDTQIQTEGNKGWQTKGRFSLYDNTDGGFLKVIMRNLTKSDEGKYWCGVKKTFLDDYTEVNLKVKEGKEKVYRVAGYVGDDITIKCKYKYTDKHKIKYLCKNTAVGCEDRIRTDRKDQWERRDRFSLYDDTTGGFFMIITKLTEEDSGTYWCVVDEPVSADSKVSVDTFKTIQLDVGPHSGLPSIKMIGYVGGAVMIKCSFLRNYATKKKYLRKMISPGPGYEDKITTDVNDKWTTLDRFSLFYNSSGNFSLVKIRELTNDDVGTYQCAVDIPFNYNRQVSVGEHMDVRLLVEKDACCESHVRINVVPGEQLNISCKYPVRHRANPKFFCRENDHFECRYKFTSQDSREKREMGLYSLHDDKGSRVVVVSFKNITNFESGQYWCGVQVNRELGGYKTFITKISLRVKASLTPSSSSPRSSTETQSKTSTVSLRPTPEEVTVQVKTSPVTIAQTHGSPVVLPISMIIMLILMGIVLFTFVECRESRGKEPTSILTNTQDNNEQRADCDYEEVKDTDISASGHSTVCAVYAVAQLPTDTCTDPHCSTVQLHISPGDDPTYSTMQYSPGDHSEGSGYASVTFRKNLSSNNESVTLNTDELSCDYATVNCPSHT